MDTNSDQRQKNWDEIQQAKEELLLEIRRLIFIPTEEQLQSMSDAYKTLHCHAVRFVTEREA